MEQSAKERAHPVLTREDLPAGAGIAVLGCLNEHEPGVPVCTQKGVDAMRISFGKDGTGGVQELTLGDEERPEALEQAGLLVDPPAQNDDGV